MKRIFIFSLVFTILTSCKKDKNSLSAPNTVTYTSNGKTYSVSEKNSNTNDVNTPPLIYVDCFISKYDTYSRFWLQVQGDKLPFNLLIDNMSGPASGIGTYPIQNGDGDVEEKFSGGQGLYITGGSITVTEASNTKITGSFVFKSVNKMTTGTFSINQPVQ